MTPFYQIHQAAEPYVIEAQLISLMVMLLVVKFAIDIIILLLCKVSITLFICAAADIPTEQAMRWIMWPIKAMRENHSIEGG